MMQSDKSTTTLDRLRSALYVRPIPYLSPLSAEVCATRLQAESTVAKGGKDTALTRFPNSTVTQFRWKTKTQAAAIPLRGTLEPTADGLTRVMVVAGRYYSLLGQIGLVGDVLIAGAALVLLLRGERLGVFGYLIVAIPIFLVLGENASRKPREQALENLRGTLEIGSADVPGYYQETKPFHYHASTNELLIELLNVGMILILLVLLFVNLRFPNT